MKKLLIICLVMLLSITLIAGCGQKAKQQTQEQSESSQEQASDNSQDKIIIKLGDALSENHPHTQSYYFFAKRMAELTNGKVEVQVFPNSQLGNQRDMVEGLQMGTLQMCKSMMTVLASFLPEVQVFDLPYIFRDRDHFYKVLDGPVGQSFLHDKLPKIGVVGVALFDAGVRSVYNSKHPIKTLDDMKGLKLRVPESPIYIDMMAAFGATGTPMAASEMYTALQTHVIDGAENAPIFYNDQKHYEVSKYFSYTNHIMTPDVLMISKKFYDTLPKDIQEAVLKAGLETQQYERKLWQDLENKTLEDLKTKGVEFNEVDTAPFKEAAQKVWGKYQDKLGKDLIQQIVDTK
ncbi:MAG: TRAP-type transport system periplasmic protein [Tepidanaerobacteraceae bacterium]|nr:TRAP-type transport system periplasmic protein [Tepidanaerobacteraceae bacterium]